MTEYEIILIYGKIYNTFTDNDENITSYIVRYKNIYYLLQNYNDFHKEVIKLGVK